MKSSLQVVITTKGIRIVAPSIGNKENVVIHIQNSEIVKVVLHCSKQLHIIFLYTKPSCARFIAGELQMTQTTDNGELSKLFEIW